MGLVALGAEERKVFSPHGEDGVLEAIFAAVGTTNRFFVEFGCENAVEGNSAYLLTKGWAGLLMDGSGISQNPRATIHNEFITAENINYLFRKYSVPAAFDLLSIDIDGNDYWVWKAIRNRPRVVVIEYNAQVPLDQRRTIAYDPNFVWNGTDYFGASLRALVELGEQKGYTLVHCERNGINAFFVANEVLPKSFTPQPLELIYRPCFVGENGLRYPHDSSRQLIDPLVCFPPPAPPTTETFELLTMAMQHHQGGRYQAAEKLYREFLQREPNQIDALHLLGVVLHQIDQRGEALDYIQRAILLNGQVATFHNSLANVYKARQRFDEAVVAYHKAIELMPNYAEAFNNLGNTFQAMGKPDEAVAAFQRAVALDPRFTSAYNNLGNALVDQEKSAEAVVAYRRSLELMPHNAEVYNRLGNALQDEEKVDEAVVAYRQALALRPDYAEVFNNLGNALRGQKKVDEAIASFRQSLALKADFAEAHNNLGSAWMDKKDFEQASQCFQMAIECKPRFAEAYNNLSAAQKERRQFVEAEASCRQALNLMPNFAVAYSSLGGVLREQGKFEDAIQCFHRSLELGGDKAEIHFNLGNVLRDLGKVDEAMAAYQQALKIKPEYAEVHANLGMALLLVEEWERGWSEFEWRWQTKDLPARKFPQPLWQGESLVGKTIFFHAEQGLGDTLQFIRYAAILKQTGAKVLVECHRPLVRLLEKCPGVDQLVGRGSVLPAFDVHIPFMSVAKILKTSLATIPTNVPYVFPSPTLVHYWRERLQEIDGFKVGIHWQGNSQFQSDHFRSFPLSHFAPLAQLPNVRLLSLQKGEGTEQLEKIQGQFLVTNLAAELDQQSGPFMDTAAVMKNLDLIVTSDTATAHLAGALGVPVWVAVPFSPDWRWLLKRVDSPWYPTMRLFRQKEPGNWHGVFEEIKQALCLVHNPKR